MWQSIRADFDAIRHALLHGDSDDPLSGTKSVGRPNGRVAEVMPQVVRDHDPPVSARAPSLSPHAEKSLAVVQGRIGHASRWTIGCHVQASGRRTKGRLASGRRAEVLAEVCFYVEKRTTTYEPVRRRRQRVRRSNRGRVTMISLAQVRVAALQRLALMREPLTIYPSASLECQANKLRAVTVMHLRRQLRAIGRSDCRASGAHRVRPQRETASSACLKSTNGFVRII